MEPGAKRRRVAGGGKAGALVPPPPPTANATRAHRALAAALPRLDAVAAADESRAASMLAEEMRRLGAAVGHRSVHLLVFHWAVASAQAQVPWPLPKAAAAWPRVYVLALKELEWWEESCAALAAVAAGPCDVEPAVPAGTPWAKVAEPLPRETAVDAAALSAVLTEACSGVEVAGRWRAAVGSLLGRREAEAAVSAAAAEHTDAVAARFAAAAAPHQPAAEGPLYDGVAAAVRTDRQREVYGGGDPALLQYQVSARAGAPCARAGERPEQTVLRLLAERMQAGAAVPADLAFSPRFLAALWEDEVWREAVWKHAVPADPPRAAVLALRAAAQSGSAPAAAHVVGHALAALGAAASASTASASTASASTASASAPATADVIDAAAAAMTAAGRRQVEVEGAARPAVVLNQLTPLKLMDGCYLVRALLSFVQAPQDFVSAAAAAAALTPVSVGSVAGLLAALHPALEPGGVDVAGMAASGSLPATVCAALLCSGHLQADDVAAKLPQYPTDPAAHVEVLSAVAAPDQLPHRCTPHNGYAERPRQPLSAAGRRHAGRSCALLSAARFHCFGGGAGAAIDKLAAVAEVAPPSGVAPPDDPTWIEWCVHGANGPPPHAPGDAHSWATDWLLAAVIGGVTLEPAPTSLLSVCSAVCVTAPYLSRTETRRLVRDALPVAAEAVGADRSPESSVRLLLRAVLILSSPELRREVLAVQRLRGLSVFDTAADEEAAAEAAAAGGPLCPSAPASITAVFDAVVMAVEDGADVQTCAAAVRDLCSNIMLCSGPSPEQDQLLRCLRTLARTISGRSDTAINEHVLACCDVVSGEWADGTWEGREAAVAAVQAARAVLSAREPADGAELSAQSPTHPGDGPSL